MPLYDYRCAACGRTFEARHGFTAPAPACPVCGTPDPQRLITAAPGVLNGNAAYAGDSRGATKEQLRDKWAEETPKLREKLASKLGDETVNKFAPSLNHTYD